VAAQTCGTCQHATRGAATADSVRFTGNGESLAVTNHDSTGLIYFRLDGTTAVSLADDTYVVRPGQTKVLPGSFGDQTRVSLISSVAAAYSVEIF
jgi:hypothetical protein